MNASPASRPLLLLVAFALVSAPAGASAQRSTRTPPPATTPAPTAEEVRDEQARVLFEQGRAAFTASRFAEALDLFRQAYALSGRHALLYNIGQAADRLRLDRDALEAFDRYLTEIPDAQNRVEVETRIGVLRETIARDEQLRAEAGRPAVTPEDDAPIEEQWWFWTLIGLGVAGAGVGIGFAVLSRDELLPFTMGDVGPGGVVMAIEVRP